MIKFFDGRLEGKEKTLNLLLYCLLTTDKEPNDYILSKDIINLLIGLIPVDAMSYGTLYQMTISSLKHHKDYELYKNIFDTYQSSTMDMDHTGDQQFQSILNDVKVIEAHDFLFEQQPESTEWSKVLMALIKRYSEYNDSELMNILAGLAIKYKRLDILYWMVDMYKVYPDDRYFMLYANEEILKHFKYNPQKSSLYEAIHTISIAAEAGNLAFLQLYHTEFQFCFTSLFQFDEYKRRTSSIEKLLNDLLQDGKVEMTAFILDHMDWILEQDAKVYIDNLPMDGDQPVVALGLLQVHSDRVICRLKYVYAAAIKANRMDFIEPLEQLIFTDTHVEVDFKAALLAALYHDDKHYLQTLLDSRRSLYCFDIDLVALSKASIESQRMLLPLATRGTLIYSIPLSIYPATLIGSQIIDTIRLIVDSGQFDEVLSKVKFSNFFFQVACINGQRDLVIKFYSTYCNLEAWIDCSAYANHSDMLHCILLSQHNTKRPGGGKIGSLKLTDLTRILSSKKSCHSHCKTIIDTIWPFVDNEILRFHHHLISLLDEVDVNIHLYLAIIESVYQQPTYSDSDIPFIKFPDKIIEPTLSQEDVAMFRSLVHLFNKDNLANKYPSHYQHILIPYNESQRAIFAKLSLEHGCHIPELFQ
ncbi:hypothetical protein SAMD00019534_101240 [Acytostelium subglobosum LB1]|uniref:hypothetical protein n=1 Tax=Acytostelium subglobosum LB1 TaxID=1410327 RepID=UPI0006448828|nr:hypothetical protein SAMD00019534_101240 [Acytostelium subglobosum LB1]GAM26949.1 hypothetical protein SAMD00019534_101240 [Acytostelium subglobosum LB1]|eukprot:XP_012750217.1 hypothetical protein SAMD00019534_101240 [Acytostelium subglobosum LB1]